MEGSSFYQLIERICGGSESGGEGDLRSVSLDLGDGALIELADEGDDVLGLYATVATFDEEPGEAVFKDISIANFGCAGTEGATLGYDPETRTLLLVRYWPIGAMETTAAVEVVSLFVETFFTWRDRIEKWESLSILPSDEAGSSLEKELHNFA
jgi:hypothetical protein